MEMTRDTPLRGVELPLALARFGGEVAHQILVGVAQFADDLVDPVADLLAALGRYHVGKAAARSSSQDYQREE